MSERSEQALRKTRVRATKQTLYPCSIKNAPRFARRSFTATTSFVVFGLLVTDYAVICMIIGFVSTYVGQIGLNVLMKKNSRNSYIAFSIGGVVLLSAFLMGVEAVLSIAESKNHHVGGLCGVSD